MAGDNNKNSAADTEIIVSEAKVGDGGPNANRFHFRLPKISIRHIRARSLFITLLLLLVLVTGGIFLFLRQAHIGDKVYAQAAGHKIYESDIKQLIRNTPSISNHQAAVVLADKYLTEAMGKEDKVSVTKQDIQTAYGEGVFSQAKTDPFYYQQNINKLYFQKLSIYNQTGVYKGEFLIANFSENVPYPSPLLKEQEAANPYLGSDAAIAADKKYADNLLTKLYNQIMTHKITFAQAINDERNDPKVGVKAYPTQPHSGSFNTLNGLNTIVDADVTKNKLRTIKQGTITEPFVAGGSNYLAGPYYLVIRMDEASGGPGLPYGQFLQQAKQKFGYKVYV